MFALLADMLKRGNPIDIVWFAAGAWLLLMFVGLMVVQLVRHLRSRKRPPPSQG